MRIGHDVTEERSRLLADVSSPSRSPQPAPSPAFERTMCAPLPEVPVRCR